MGNENCLSFSWFFLTLSIQISHMIEYTEFWLFVPWSTKSEWIKNVYMYKQNFSISDCIFDHIQEIGDRIPSGQSIGESVLVVLTLKNVSKSLIAKAVTKC